MPNSDYDEDTFRYHYNKDVIAADGSSFSLQLPVPVRAILAHISNTTFYGYHERQISHDASEAEFNSVLQIIRFAKAIAELIASDGDDPSLSASFVKAAATLFQKLRLPEYPYGYEVVQLTGRMGVDRSGSRVPIGKDGVERSVTLSMIREIMTGCTVPKSTS